MADALQIQVPAPEAGPPTHALDDAERLEALSRTRLMDSAPEPVFDRLSELATRLLGTPVSLVSLVDDHRQFFKSACGLPEPRETPLSHSFCQHVVTSGEPLVIPDARRDPRVSKNLAIPDLGVIAYLGIPLMTLDGQPLGSFCAIDGEPRQWTEDDVRLMSDLALAVQSEIGLRLTLADAEALAEERDLLIAELNHRMKNVFAMVNGMIGLTARNSADTADMAERLRGRVTALSDAHALVEPAITGRIAANGGLPLGEIVRSILTPHHLAGGIDVRGESFQLESQAGSRLSLVLHELATNAAKYGALSQPGGHITVDWTETHDHLLIGWTETNPNVNVTEPVKADHGFGTRLIEGAVRAQMDGTVSRHWGENGLSVSLVLSRSQVEQR
ncbi:MAG: GAF domain-containing protein [Litorimonas sp.]